MKITARLDKLALWYDYTTVCDNIEYGTETFYDEEYKCEMARRKLLLTNPVDYTREELLKKYDGKMRISRWEHTYTESGEPSMAVIIKEKNSN